jgi:hypothetical protein
MRILTNTKMGVYTGVPCCASQVFILTIRYMKMRLRVSVLLCKPKIDNIHLVTTFAYSHQKIIGFDIPMDKRLCVYILNAGNLHRLLAHTRMRGYNYQLIR